MNKFINNFMYNLSDIIELQKCVSDVMENTINNNKDNSHLIVLIREIINKSEALYSEIDEYSLHC